MNGYDFQLSTMPEEKHAIADGCNVHDVSGSTGNGSFSVSLHPGDNEFKHVSELFAASWPSAKWPHDGKGPPPKVTQVSILEPVVKLQSAEHQFLPDSLLN